MGLVVNSEAAVFAWQVRGALVLSGPLQRGAGTLQENALKCGSPPAGFVEPVFLRVPKSSLPLSLWLSLSPPAHKRPCEVDHYQWPSLSMLWPL